MANDFFGKFAEQVGGVTDAAVEPAAPEAAAPPATAEKPSGGISPMVWIAGLIAVVAIGLLIFTSS